MAERPATHPERCHAVPRPPATRPAEPTRADLRSYFDQVQGRGEFDVVAVGDGIAETTSISVSPSAVPPALDDAVDQGRVAALRTQVAGRPTVVVGGAIQPAGPAFAFFFPLDGVTADLALLARVLAVTSRVGVLVSAGIGAVAASGVLRPIRRTRAAVREVTSGDLYAELPVRGNDELAELARAFNRMTAALRRTVGELRELESTQRRFVSDVSHELRTPLTALTTAADVLDANTDGLGDAGRPAARRTIVETNALARLADERVRLVGPAGRQPTAADGLAAGGEGVDH